MSKLPRIYKWHEFMGATARFVVHANVLLVLTAVAFFYMGTWAGRDAYKDEQ